MIAARNLVSQENQSHSEQKTQLTANLLNYLIKSFLISPGLIRTLNFLVYSLCNLPNKTLKNRSEAQMERFENRNDAETIWNVPKKGFFFETFFSFFVGRVGRVAQIQGINFHPKLDQSASSSRLAPHERSHRRRRRRVTAPSRADEIISLHLKRSTH